MTADTEGRVVVSADGQEQVIAAQLPQGCVPELEEVPPYVGFAGRMPVLSYLCEDGSRLVVYDQAGQPHLVVEGGAGFGFRVSGAIRWPGHACDVAPVRRRPRGRADT